MNLQARAAKFWRNLPLLPLCDLHTSRHVPCISCADPFLLCSPPDKSHMSLHAECCFPDGHLCEGIGRFYQISDDLMILWHMQDCTLLASGLLDLC